MTLGITINSNVSISHVRIYGVDLIRKLTTHLNDVSICAFSMNPDRLAIMNIEILLERIISIGAISIIVR